MGCPGKRKRGKKTTLPVLTVCAYELGNQASTTGLSFLVLFCHGWASCRCDCQVSHTFPFFFLCYAASAVLMGRFVFVFVEFFLASWFAVLLVQKGIRT